MQLKSRVKFRRVPIVEPPVPLTIVPKTPEDRRPPETQVLSRSQSSIGTEEEAKEEKMAVVLPLVTLPPYAIHVMPGTHTLCPHVYPNPLEPHHRRVLTIFYYVSDMAQAQTNLNRQPHGLGIRRALQRYLNNMGFSSIDIQIIYMGRPQHPLIFECPPNKSFFFEHQFFNGLGLEYLQTSFSRIDYAKKTAGTSAYARGIIVTDPREQVPEAQPVDQPLRTYTQELVYYLSHPPVALTPQEWASLGVLRGHHNRNMITFVFQRWPSNADLDNFNERINGAKAQIYAASVGFQIRPNMAFTCDLPAFCRLTIGRAIKSIQPIHEKGDPLIGLMNYEGRQPGDRLEIHHIVRRYPPVPNPFPGVNLNQGFEWTPFEVAVHCKVVFRMFFHYNNPVTMNNGYGIQPIDHLVHGIFGPNMDATDAYKNYHQVMLHPVVTPLHWWQVNFKECNPFVHYMSFFDYPVINN